MRLGEYERLTRPLLDYYEASKRLHRIDGESETEEIYNQIARLLEENASASSR